MSKGERRFPVTKLVRLTKEDARVLESYARLWTCSQSEAIRRLLRRKKAA